MLASECTVAVYGVLSLLEAIGEVEKIIHILAKALQDATMICHGFFVVKFNFAVQG